MRCRRTIATGQERHRRGRGSARQVAQELGRSRDWFYRHRKRLEAAGFPPPLCTHRMWSREKVEAWIEADLAGELPAIAEGLTREEVVWQRRLADRIPAVLDGLPRRQSGRLKLVIKG